jgi:hypothetical protein
MWWQDRVTDDYDGNNPDHAARAASCMSAFDLQPPPPAEDVASELAGARACPANDSGDLAETARRRK